jgi:nicotinate-nucleotide adenylyltransferase
VSEQRDLWVPAALALLGLALLGWNASEGRLLVGVAAATTALVAAGACLPLRLKRGQRAVVTFASGVALVLLAFAPALAPSLAAGTAWVVAGLSFLLPTPPLPARVRAGLLAAAGLLALAGLLAHRGALPAGFRWLGLAGAFLLAVQALRSRPRRPPERPPGPRIVLFGGSFDPFHAGHRALAEAALKVADRLLVVPAGQAPHKQAQVEATPFHHRLAMCHLGIEGLPRTEVLTLEGRRSGPSYTVDTLEVVKKSFPEDARFLLLLGADMFQEFPTWHEWERILDLAALLVAARPGHDLEPPPEFEGRSLVLERLEAPQVDVSGTDLRRDLAVGRSVGDRVSPAVQAYIREHQVYGARGE